MKVLFVCSGNTCRSPLAEAIARTIAAERGLRDIEFSSAGTGALDGGGASEAAILVGLERAVDLSVHRTRALTPAMVDEADLVLVMAPSHFEAVTTHGPEEKIHLLDHFASGGVTSEAVNDPFGGDLEAYRATATELKRKIERVLDRISHERG